MAGFSPERIAQVGLQCADLGQAKKFYCGALGLSLAGELPDSIFVKCGEVNLIIQKMAEPRRGSQIYFSADGRVHQATQDLKAQGIAFTQEPRRIAKDFQGVDVWLGSFSDPWGNPLALIANMPPEP
jgi:catechol-2,3-dioxygenase